MNKYLFVFVFWAMLSCSEQNKNAVDAVNETSDGVSVELETENGKLKDSLFFEYQSLLKSSSDTGVKSKAVFLFEKVSQTDNFLDSLQAVVKQLDRNDVENVKTIRELLAEGISGDSLSNCLENTFLQAKDFSGSQEQKTAIDSIRARVFMSMGTGRSWQEELFGSTGPLGASYILSGLQNELYNVGRVAFKQ
ncbi:MAG TPA: hypothetical protein VLC98_15065 [Phnomibacter sp.]|nr:hypothetical protein [Phnomibacter sp.]